MGKFREKIRHAIPWIDPVIEYFDWKKSITTAAATVIITGGSIVKDLPWPVIVTIALAVPVQTIYLIYLPAFLKIVHTGIKSRPDKNIWKHKKQFKLYEAACLLADAEPVYQYLQMDGDSRAWYSGLCEAIKLNEIKHIPSEYDENHTGRDGYTPFEHTTIAAQSLKAFCKARARTPEFLTWE